VTEGTEVRVKILSVDTTAKRISLSIREALTDEAAIEGDAAELTSDDFAL
jgi:ribosomal protein S1